MRLHRAVVVRLQRPGAWFVVAFTSCLVLVMGCGGGPSTKGPVAVPVPSALTVQVCAQVEPNEGGDTLRAMMLSVDWAAGCSPLYTDDQRFNDGQGGYGPLAHAAPLPGDAQSDLASFAVTVPVGIVVVDTTSGATLPAPYHNLKLKPGTNCVFFRHDPGPQVVGWHAYVNQPVSGVCQPPTTTGSELPVNVFHSGPFGSPNDYPAVGRFHEALTQPGEQPVTLVGFKCAAAYCFVQPSASVIHSDHIGVIPGMVTWEVHGWGDEQHVGVPPGPSAPVKPQWTFNSSILPVRSLDTLKILHFNGDTILVADIYLKTPPPPGSKYVTQWHMAMGHNYIFLKHDPAAARDVGWSGFLRHSLTSVPGDQFNLKVVRHDHTGLNVVGTARLAWSQTDEDGWVRCDAGCCYFSGT